MIRFRAGGFLKALMTDILFAPLDHLDGTTAMPTRIYNDEIRNTMLSRMAMGLKETIDGDEITSAQETIKRIVEQPVEELLFDNSIPTIADCSDSNRVFKGRLSILFVDIRKSTDLADNTDPKTMVKVYRAFMRLVLQCVRYSGGFTRQFAGDGIMGVFAEGDEGEVMPSSQEKAVSAARQMVTLIDYCLNPALDGSFDGIRIGCGIGVSTGEVMITKVGMRGREADDAVENEMGVVWAGSVTNYASKYCSLAQSGEIFIDAETLSVLSEKSDWEETARTKGGKLFRGYAWRNAYCELPEGFALVPCKAEIEVHKESFAQDIMKELRSEAMTLVDDIAAKSSELATAKAATEQEQQAAASAKESDERERRSVRAEKYRNEYEVIKKFFSSMWCKNDAIKASGLRFWQEMLDRAYKCASECGISEESVTDYFAMYMSRTYYLFEKYEDAYDMYCHHARCDSWISYYFVQGMIEKSGHWIALRDIVKSRIDDDDSFGEAAAVLKKMGKWE